jgi:hypothetical protein
MRTHTWLAWGYRYEEFMVHAPPITELVGLQ